MLTFFRAAIVLGSVITAIVVDRVAQTAPIPGRHFLFAACLILIVIACLARTVGQLVAALTGVAFGILAGRPLVGNACIPLGLFLGPAVGLSVAVDLRPSTEPESRSMSLVRWFVFTTSVVLTLIGIGLGTGSVIGPRADVDRGSHVR